MSAQVEPCVFLKRADNGQRKRHDCWLRILGEDEIRLRPLPHQPRQSLGEHIVDFFEGLACRSKGFGQSPPHADALAPLSGKNESSQRNTPFYSPLNWDCLWRKMGPSTTRADAI